MIGAAKRKSSLLPGLAALRLVLLLIVTLCLGETRVWGFGITSPSASGVFESVTLSPIGENTIAWQYDASDSPLAARTTTGFRYVTEGEIKAIKDTGMLRGGRPGETFFTKDVYKSGAHAQERLSLPTTPTHRIEFEITNNPTMLRNGTKVEPVGSLTGKGSEFMTTDQVHVDLINVQSLR